MLVLVGSFSLNLVDISMPTLADWGPILVDFGPVHPEYRIASSFRAKISSINTLKWGWPYSRLN